MSRSTLLLIFSLSILAVLLGYNYFVQPFADIFTLDQTADTSELTEQNVSPADQLLTQLSTQEKVWQMIAAPYTVTASESAQVTVAELIALKPGFITLFGEQISTQSARRVHQATTNQQPLPIWLAVDHEGGRVQRLNGVGFTRVPSWQELCQLESENRAIVLEKTASELARVGIKVVFAPMVDVASNSAVLGNRVCSHEPRQVITASREFVDIFTHQKILPVLKHFPGIGGATRDLHQSFDRITVSEHEALIYRELLTTYPLIGVMTTHVGVTNQYPDVPCSLSSACVGELRTNFSQPLIFTDALDMRGASYQAKGGAKSLEQVSLEAVLAENDVLVYGRGVTTEELTTIVDMIAARAASESGVMNKIDHSVRKIIEYKMASSYE